MKYGSYVACYRKAHGPARLRRVLTSADSIALSEWLILSGDLSSARSTIAKIGHPGARFLQAAKASRHFEDESFTDGIRLPSWLPSDWTLPILRASASIARKPGDCRRAEAFFRRRSFWLSSEQRTKALVAVSNAYRNAGDLSSSLRLAGEAFEAARSVTPGSPGGASIFDSRFAYKRQTAFHDLQRVTNFWQHSLFLCSGTLLGFFRDGDFIPSDGDVDLGTLNPDGFSSLKRALRVSGCFFLSTGRVNTNFSAKHVNGTKIDISQYVRRSHGWAKTSHVYEWQFGEFTIGELATDYGRLPIPCPTEDYLTAMYEDWRIPLSGYDSRIHSPNLMNVSPEEVGVVMASHYLASYLAGGPATCERWTKKFEGLQPKVRETVDPLVAILS